MKKKKPIEQVLQQERAQANKRKVRKKTDNPEPLKKGRRSRKDASNPIMLGQLKTLWEANVPVREIAAQLGCHVRTVYRVIKDHEFEFTPRQTVKAHVSGKMKDPNIDRFVEMWHAGDTVKTIMEELGMSQRRIYSLKTSLNLPNRKTQEVNARGAMHHLNDEEKQLILPKEVTDDLMVKAVTNQRTPRHQLHPKVAQYVKEYEAENIQQIRAEEFQKQMQVTDALEHLAFEAISVMGFTAGEIAGFTDEEALLRKIQAIKGASDIFHKGLDTRRKLVRLDEPTAQDRFAGMFDIDYEGAARDAGLHIPQNLIQYDDRDSHTHSE